MAAKFSILFKCIFLASLLFIFNAFGHPFYLSVTELNYNQKARSLQGSVKIFTNDLEDALRKLNNKPVDLINGKDVAANSIILHDYLRSRLKVWINGAEKVYDFVGYEHENEAIWIYLEVKNCEVPKNIKIANTILYDYLNGQSNIVHVEVNGNSHSSKVNYPDNQLNFDF